MAADATLTPPRPVSPWYRLPPGGEPIGWSQLREVFATGDPEATLTAEIRGRLGAAAVTYHASGREALRALLVHWAARSGRTEVVVPAYTCFSVPSAVVAAGLRVRLVDVDARGRIDLVDLARQPLERALAVIVCNLFGLAEPLGPVQELAAAAGAWVIDDAAQSVGAHAEGPVGGRGDAGILSFGRGKPLCGLGGGAIAWREAPREFERPPLPPTGRLRAVARGLAWNLSLSPRVFPWLAAIPPLQIGATHFDPAFRRGGIDGASLALAAAHCGAWEAQAAERQRCAERRAQQLAGIEGLGSLVTLAGARGVYPRLAVLAQDAERRAHAIAALAPLGAAAFYPCALGAVPGLAHALAGPASSPGAEALAARLLTLATHRGSQRALEHGSPPRHLGVVD